jgi:hypothetical protein
VFTRIYRLSLPIAGTYFVFLLLKVLGFALMDEIRAPKYEEHFTAFIDLLGFSEISAGADEDTRQEVLAFLVSLAALRSEFNIESPPDQPGTTYMKPAVSTFSDHIVISYPFEQISAGNGFDESRTASYVFYSFKSLLTEIARKALSIGLLIRGGATIGKLYHSGGVIFGEALVDAYQIESRTSVYPRVVLSSKVCNRENWMEWHAGNLRRGQDGLYYFDYYRELVFSDHFLELVYSSALSGPNWEKEIKARFENIIRPTDKNLRDLEGKGKLTELSKWAWFAHEFRSALERVPAETLAALGLSLDAIPWKN